MEDNRMKRLFISLLLLLTPFALIQGDEKEGSSSSEHSVDLDRVLDKQAVLDKLAKYWAKACEKKYPDKEFPWKSPEDYRFPSENSYYCSSAWIQVNDDIRECPENASSIIEQLGINPNTELPFADSPYGRMDVLGKTALDVIRSYLNESSDEPNCPIEAIVSLLSKGGDPFARSDFLYEFYLSPTPEPLPAYEVVEKEALQLKQHLEKGSEYSSRADLDSRYTCAKSILKLFEDFRKGFELTAKVREEANELKNRVEVLVKKTDNTIKETEKFIEERKKLNDETLENIKKKQATKSND